MKLEKFRVVNFRSIKDSGWVTVAGLTALVGRNESGKSNLLHALRMLDREGIAQTIPLTRDFPADLASSEYTDDQSVVRAVWSLSQEERTDLGRVYPPAAQMTEIEVSRGYGPGLRVQVAAREDAAPPVERAKELLAHFNNATVAGAGPDAYQRWQDALKGLYAATSRDDLSTSEWAAGVNQALADAQEPIAGGAISVDDDTRSALQELLDLASRTDLENGDEGAVIQWMQARMPRLLYLDAFPDIDGRRDLVEYSARIREGKLEPRDHYFRMLLSVGGIESDDIEALIQGAPDVRRQMVGRAGATLTRRLRQIWTNRALKIRFDLDGSHFNTIVSDPTSLCDVEVNLDQRSRGFRWFFSFWILFAAGVKEGTIADAVVLLDEPGMHLHAVGQKDLLKHLAEDFDNQVILATQSPYMTPSGEGSAIRTVSLHEEEGTLVTEGGEVDEGAESASDATTQAVAVPMVSAATQEIANSLFGDTPRLIVEDTSDFWYLQAVSDYLAEKKRPTIPKDLVITPAGGAHSVPYFMSLLDEGVGDSIVLVSEWNEDIAKSVDAERDGDSDHLVYVAAAYEEDTQRTAHVEDLFDDEVYDRFVRFAYQKELDGKELEPDPDIARVIPRYEAALGQLGIRFHRTRPARLLLRIAGRNPQSIFTRDSREAFERLFSEIQRKYKRLSS